MASERHGQPYIQVFYNDLKMPIIKEWIDQQGETNKKEVLGCLRRNNHVTVLYKQNSNTVSGDFWDD